MHDDVLLQHFQRQQRLLGLEPRRAIIGPCDAIPKRNGQNHADAPLLAVATGSVVYEVAEIAAYGVQAVAALQINLRPELVVVELHQDVAALDRGVRREKIGPRL